MADLKDYYKVLGVKDSASAADVKRAYRELARSHHPDRNPGDPHAEETFKAVQEAYAVLSDAERRKKYDQRRRSRASGRRFSTRNGTTYRTDAGDTYVRQTPPRARKPADPSPADEEKLFKGLGGLFKNVFAPGEGREGRASLDAHKTIRIAFEDAVQGGRTEVETPRGGRVRVRIPRGVRSGFKIRVGGEGHQAEGRSGDLFVTFDVAPHPTFERDGLDLVMTLRISAFEAMLGTVRTVTDAYGKQVKLAVPPGTQPGERLRLRDMGIQTDDNVGDLYVEIEVTVPRNLTHEQREALRRAAAKAGLMES